MILTGKCKQDFEEWFNKGVTDKLSYGTYLLGRFYGVPLSMQFGVIQEFADSVKICVTVQPIDDWNWWGFDVILEDSMSPFFVAFDSVIIGKEYASRQEAQEAAIAKFNEIYNER